MLNPTHCGLLREFDEAHREVLRHLSSKKPRRSAGRELGLRWGRARDALRPVFDGGEQDGETLRKIDDWIRVSFTMMSGTWSELLALVDEWERMSDECASLVCAGHRAMRSVKLDPRTHAANASVRALLA